MRAREPDAGGLVDRDGLKLHYEVFGDGRPTLLLLPTWTIIHTRFWKAQVPYLARHFRVVTYDGPGNGRSDRPLDAGPYGYEEQARAAGTVLDATGTDQAVLVSLSMASQVDEATLRRWCAASRRCPVLVVHGTKDRISPLRDAEALAEAIGGALVVLEGAGHVPLARDPVKVNRLIREFAESLPAGGPR
jgi:pimeloyl-ACP methyl ester carboxylesterase